MKRITLGLLTIGCLLAHLAPAAAGPASKAKPAATGPSYDPSVPKPTVSGARYGMHERHILDFWKSEENTMPSMNTRPARPS